MQPKTRNTLAALMALLIFLLPACGDDTVFTPKPRSYPKVNYPEKRAYLLFDKDYCHFTFEYPAYAKIERDTSFFDKLPPDPCWFNLYFEQLNARLYCSYLPVGSYKSFEELRDDAFEMADWHIRKASYIDEQVIHNPQGVEGISFEFEGPTATPFQFYLTDTTRTHFFRAGLYFESEVNTDSLAPVYNFLKTDIKRLIESFRWEGE